MNERDLLLQRYCDGELDAETANGVRRMLANDADAAKRVADLDFLQQSLQQPSTATHDERLVQRVINRIGGSQPLRSVQPATASAGSVIVIGSTGLAVGLLLTMQNNLAAFLPMALIATVLLGLGLLGIVLANPLRSLEKSLLGKLLRRRLTVAPAEITSYRVASLIVAIGALWILLSQ
jgi:anti-sigma factor RsiW